MIHPEINVAVSRGGITESEHRITAVVMNSAGDCLESWGNVIKPVFPRSAIKGLQVLAFVERGGVEQFGFSESELALCCASHNGEKEHVAGAQSMLQKLGLTEQHYECGLHWPMRAEAAYELAREQSEPDQRHNNCSGKHAGMLGLASLLGVDAKGYIDVDHPVQKTIEQTMSEMCEFDMSAAPVSPDGCSAPTWAIPLKNLALGFAKFGDPSALPEARAKACHKIFNAVVNHPFMVAGTDRYCTQMMQVLGNKAFLKVGAEGVYIAAVPEQKIAIALKCEDGATRGAERALTAILDHLGVTRDIAVDKMAQFREPRILNRNAMQTGSIQCDQVI
jgi:L-asparaginase II